MWLVPSFEDTRKAVLRDTASHRLLLRGARLADSRVADIVIADGMIISVSGGPTGDPSHAEVVDLSGYLVLPSLAEPAVSWGHGAIA